MFVRKLKKYLKFIIPIFANALFFFLVLYLFFSKFPPEKDNVYAIMLIICGGCSLIICLCISISSLQLIEFFMYITYRIKKFFNHKYSKYDDPNSFIECHEFLSSEKYISLWFGYFLSIAILVTGIIIKVTVIVPIVPYK